jgi:hypothetical protein
MLAGPDDASSEHDPECLFDLIDLPEAGQGGCAPEEAGGLTCPTDGTRFYHQGSPAKGSPSMPPLLPR